MVAKLQALDFGAIYSIRYDNIIFFVDVCSLGCD